jgi:putative hemolysin
MDNVPLEIIIILGLILTNGLLAMSEIAVVSSRKVRLQQRAEQGDKRAQSALDLANSPARFLSTVQIGITLVGILAGAFGGATMAQNLNAYLNQIPVLSPYSGAISLGIVVLAITYLSLVLGELVPKQIALSDPERVSSAVAPLLQVLSRITSPIVSLLSASSRIVLKLLRIQPSKEPSVTEEEIKIMIGQGARIGVFLPIEEELVDQVFRLGDLKVGALMTPRTEVTWFDIEDTMTDIRSKLSETNHTFYPVASGSLDNVAGIVGAKDLSIQLINNQAIDLKRILRAPLFVPESLPVYNLLERFKRTHSQMALVTDEFGGIEGLLTAGGILGALVGEIPEEGVSAEVKIEQREDGTWVIDGLVSIDEFKERLGFPEIPGEKTVHFHTVGGFVVFHLQKIPDEGDQFDWEGYHFEVATMDGHRVDKVLVAAGEKEQ